MQIKSKNSLLMLLLLPALASAAGIGKINVKSALGEPFKAEVEVFVSDSNELDLAVARLGSQQDYNEAGISDGYMSGISANILKKNNGRYVIELQGNQVVNEPYLELLVKLDTKTSNLMRQYTVLLDPPSSTLREDSSSTNNTTTNNTNSTDVAKNPPRKKNKPHDALKNESLAGQIESGRNNTRDLEKASLDEEKLISATQKPHALNHITASTETYTAQTGDVFGKIAQRYQPEGVPLVKVMAAFYALNKNAFVDGDMHKLKTGSIIRIPDQESLNNAGQLKTAHAITTQNQPALTPPEEPVKEPLKTAIKEVKDVPQPPAAEMQKAEPTPETNKNVVGNPTKAETNYVLKISPGDTSISTNPATSSPTTDLSTASKEGSGQGKIGTVSEASPNIGKAGSDVKSDSGNGLAAAANNSAEETSFTQTLQNYWTSIFLVFGLFLMACVAWLRYTKKLNAVKDIRNHFSPIFGEEILPIEPSATVKNSATEPTSKLYQQTIATQAAKPLLTETQFNDEDIKREFSEPPAQSINKPVDPLIEAELYMTYGRHKQAETILTSVDTPYKLELSLGLLKIYADRKDKLAFERIVHSIHDDLTSGTIEDAMVWSKVVALGAKIDPENPLYSGASKVNKLSARERAAAAEKAMRENLMSLDADNATSLANAPESFQASPEISYSSEESFSETSSSPTLEIEPQQVSNAGLVEFEQIQVPEKTNEIEFTLEDMKMPDLSVSTSNISTPDNEILNTKNETNDTGAIFAKLKDES